MRILNWVAQGLLAMVLILVVFELGPELETKFHPVYSKFTLIDVVETPEGIRAVLQFTKYRNCDPQGYAWYAGDLGVGRRELHLRTPQTGTVHRPLGTQTTQSILIEGVTIQDVPKLYAELYNRCHPFWITRSVIYP